MTHSEKRFHAAKDIAAALLSSPHKRFTDWLFDQSVEEMAVEIADGLLAELARTEPTTQDVVCVIQHPQVAYCKTCGTLHPSGSCDAPEPSNLPPHTPPPEGFTVWGIGPMISPPSSNQYFAVWAFVDGEWQPYFDGTETILYALRDGSEIQRLNGRVKA